MDVESSEPYAVSDAIDVLEAYVVVGYRLRTILTEPELLTEELWEAVAVDVPTVLEGFEDQDEPGMWERVLRLDFTEFPEGTWFAVCMVAVLDAEEDTEEDSELPFELLDVELLV